MREWTVKSMLSFSSSYWHLCALHAGVEIDLFSALSQEDKTLPVLAKDLQCSERGLAALLPALCALNLLTMTEQDKASLTAFARRYLCRDSKDYLGHIILHHHHLMPGWASLDQAVRTGQASLVNSPGHSDFGREDFLMGMFNMAMVRAAQAVAALDLTTAKTLLDLGGGPGTYAIRFCERWPSLQGVVFDRHTSEKFAQKVIAQFGLQERVHFQGGDILADPVPTGFDVVWVSHVIHGMNAEEAQQAINKAAASANPGGKVCIQEFILDDERTGPLFPALFGLNMLVATSGGKAYTESEIKAMLAQAGLVDAHRVQESEEADAGIIMAYKP